MPRRTLYFTLLAAFASFAVSAQQMPAKVERPLEPVPENIATPQPLTGVADFQTTGQLAPLATTTTAIPGLAPSATLLVKASPTVSVRRYVAPPPKPQLAVKSLGSNRYIILPQESPLLTAPLGTLSPAMLSEETETALPEATETLSNQPAKPLPAIWNEIPLAVPVIQTKPAVNPILPPILRPQPPAVVTQPPALQPPVEDAVTIPPANLGAVPALDTVPTQPEVGIVWENNTPSTPVMPQPDIATRLGELAQRLETLSTQADDMDARLSAAETTSPSDQTSDKPVPVTEPEKLTTSIPYTNDATAPGPRARKALSALAQHIISTSQAHAGAQPKNLSVVATVATPPIGQTAKQLARARHTAAWAYLNAELKSAGIKLPGTGNQLTIKTTTKPSAQKQVITVNW